MKAKHITWCLVAVVITFLATACVDKDFRLDEVSTEITVGQGTTTLKLGYLKEQKLSEIIDTEDIDGLQIDPQTGDYLLGYSGEGEDIEIDGIDHSFDIPRTMSSFTAEYPHFELIGTGYQFDEVYYIKPKIANVEIPDFEIQVEAGHVISGHEDSTASHTLSYEVPEYISSIDCIYLKPYRDGAPGAKIDVLLEFNDLKSINSGGHLNLELVAPEGYRLYDSNYRLLEDGHFKVSNYAFSSSQNEFEYELYLECIENNHPIVDGNLTLPIELEYHLSFDMTTRAGALHVAQLPELHITSDLEYEDAELTLNNVTLIEHNKPMEGALQINDLPEEVKSINEVTFTGYPAIQLIAEGIEWLDDLTASQVVIKALLPEYLTFEDDPRSGYNAQTHTLTTNLNYLRHGIVLILDALHFEGEGIRPENGTVTLDFAPDIVAEFLKGTKTQLSHLLHSGDLVLTTGIEQTTLDIESVTGHIAYSHTEQSSIDMGGLDEDYQITINDPGLSPVIAINISNPLTISATVNATLTPTCGGVLHPENSVSVKNVVVEAADYFDGNTTPKQIKLILAEEAKRSLYPQDEYTFVACDIAKLLKGEIPDTVELDLEFNTDAQSEATLYAADKYVVSYDYKVDVPLLFDQTMDITYSDVADGFDDTFDDLSDKDIKVGDIYIIAEVKTTIPLDLGFDAELIDAQGNPTEVKLIIPSDAKIEGSKDGQSESVSTIRLGVDLGKDNNARNLADIDAIRLELSAGCAAGEASLNTEQYISAQLYIELNGGITVDLDTL